MEQAVRRGRSERPPEGPKVPDAKIRDACVAVLARHRKRVPSVGDVRRLEKLALREIGGAASSVASPDVANAESLRRTVARCYWWLEWIEHWSERRAGAVATWERWARTSRWVLFGEVDAQQRFAEFAESLPVAIESDADLERAAQLLAKFEQSLEPTTLYFLRTAPSNQHERWAAFLALEPFAKEERRRHLVRFLAREADQAHADALVETVGSEHLRSFAPETLCSMSQHFARWGGIVRYFQDRRYREQCPIAVQEKAAALYDELLRRVTRSWRSEMRALDVEDAVQETVTRLVGDAFRTYRYESDLLNYLVEVSKDLLRRQYRRLTPHELAEEDPPVDGRPHALSLVEARDRCENVRAHLRPLIESKFKEPNWECAQIIFEEVLSEAEAELRAEERSSTAKFQPPIDDEELARRVRERTGRQTSVSYLRVIRCRVRAALAELLGIDGGRNP